MEVTLETWRLGSGDDERLGGFGVETTLESWWLGSGDDVGDSAAGEWR